MPYNNTPIAPSQEVTGTVSLPLARVKKIINVDPDTGNCSNNAAFCITVATEMFLQHLVEQSYTQVKTEHTQKPRRNIQYRDVANAVARVENLEFLSDVVPRTVSYKQHKQKLAKEANNPAAGNGQSTLDRHVGSKEAQATNGASDVMMGMDTWILLGICGYSLEITNRT
ncbi:hypothetical protein M409DRAFT_67536 [Zasmidium cellare ATCC 36951]|uniref:Transcription factor CBF/NF-Y/archaeal histone domain-containing protein n=1 Tax=Zasmidium cellare ATCC 36951 TaxID=1080233 RepID=A0A6A6CFT7_ZASCE|nr:uncharacterized protein M409DRAFT_67536 [Zasmidium cellare ATCC 36951]KAF2164792.1 hypothetical protein M409DRAFT_67536 [Zasmidium cellare ATCC 36951]